MLEKNQRFKSLLFVLLDAALLFVGFLLANYIRFNYVRYFEPGGAGPALAVAQDPRNICLLYTSERCRRRRECRSRWSPYH